MAKSTITLFTALLLFSLTIAAPVCGHVDEDNDIPASDGYVNIRQRDNEVLDQLTNGQIVFTFEPIMEKLGWYEVDSPYSDRVHESGLKLTESIEVRFPDKTLVLPKRAYQNLLNPVMGDYDCSTALATSVNYDKKMTRYIPIANEDLIFMA